MLKLQRLCDVSINLDNDAPIALGRSPWRNRRISYISGGSVDGERLAGTVRPGGGDWAELGINQAGDALTLVDVRSIWDTHDGAAIYVNYQGRLTIPALLLESFRDPSQVGSIDPSQYYFRIAVVFETADPRYDWLNSVIAVGEGRRTARGVDYRVWEVG